MYSHGQARLCNDDVKVESFAFFTEIALSHNALRLEICLPECHFPGTAFFPKKSRKFLSRAFGNSLFLVPTKYQHSGLYFPDFSRIFPSHRDRTIKKWSYPGLANSGIVLQSRLVSSHLKRAQERRPLLTPMPNFCQPKKLLKRWVLLLCIQLLRNQPEENPVCRRKIMLLHSNS